MSKPSVFQIAKLDKLMAKQGVQLDRSKFDEPCYFSKEDIATLIFELKTFGEIKSEKATVLYNELCRKT